MRTARGSVVGLAGAVGAGVLAFPAAAAFAATEQVYAKRGEQLVELVAVTDDDDDTNDRDTRSRDRSRTGNSNDATGSKHSKVSRDPADVADALGPVLEQQPRGRLGGFKSALAR